MNTIHVEGHEVIPTLCTQSADHNLYSVSSDGRLTGYVAMDTRGSAYRISDRDGHALRSFGAVDVSASNYGIGLYMASRLLVILTDPGHAERCDSTCEVHGSYPGGGHYR